MINDIYKENALWVLKRLKPQLTEEELLQAIEYSINKRYREVNCIVDNNYTKANFESTLREMTDWILEKEPICTAYGVMFKKHSKRPNPLIELIRSFMEQRDIDKAKMFEALDAHQYDLAETYNLFQIVDKRNANSIYGAMGNSSCVLYNLYVAASTTAQGRSIISTAILFFEGFLSNNVKFGSLEEIVTYIYNICNEPRHLTDTVLDRNITIEECFTKLIMTTGDWRRGKLKWVPDYKDMSIVYNILCTLSQEDINRIYYKNNLYKFVDNSAITNALVYILKALKKPYLTPKEIPDEIKVELDMLQEFIEEFVYYPHMYIDRMDRSDNMINNVCVISDTDSTIVSFDMWYHYVLEKVKNEDLEIVKQEFEIKSCTEDTIVGEVRKAKNPERHFDFFNDKVIETEAKIKPFTIIPQNNLRFSIINIIAYIAGNLCNKYIELYTKCNHSWAPDRKCLLYLKNEFLFSRALLTNAKKNYSTNRELQEGVTIEQNIKRALDIKGMPINKSTLNDMAKSRLQEILYNDILIAKEVRPEVIIEKIAILEKDIEESLLKGEKIFYKPQTIKALASYDDPMRIQGIKASVIWNRVKGPDLETIDLDARNTISVVKVLITPSNIEKIKDEFPDVYDRFVQLFQDNELFKKGDYTITTIAIPMSVETPVWVREFIDIKSIINDNISNFPFESVGITRLGTNSINYSTIMKI